MNVCAMVEICQNAIVFNMEYRLIAVFDMLYLAFHSKKELIIDQDISVTKTFISCDQNVLIYEKLLSMKS